jgi:hypothetical protein
VVLTGIEVAAALADKAKSVSIIDLVEVPFERVLGKAIGSSVKTVISLCVCLE